MFDFLKKLFSPQKGGEEFRGDVIWVYVQCEKCGEKMRTHISKINDLSPTYEDEGPAYVLRKELLGSKCQNIVEVFMDFDGARRLINKNIKGGKFITKEEYEEG